MSFLSSFNDFFAVEEKDHPISIREKIVAKGVDINPTVTNKLIVDAVFTDYDKINLDYAKKGHEEDYEISRNDVEKLFNLYCYQLLTEQTETEAKVSNVARSWSPLKSAFRVWFKSIFDQDIGKGKVTDNDNEPYLNNWEPNGMLDFVNAIDSFYQAQSSWENFCPPVSYHV